MENLSTIIVVIWLAIIIFITCMNLLNKYYFTNYTTTSKWLRKRIAKRALKYMASRITISNYKVEKLTANYVSNSVAIHNVYINDGYTKSEVAIIGIIEKYERFVQHYKYNTFDNLSWEDEDLISKLDKL